MKHILILGGTGAMGKHIVQLLKADGHEVFVTSRSQRTNENHITYLQGNAKDDVFLSDILKLKEWDVIVDFMIYSTQQFRSRHELLLKSCKQYVFLSSSRVYADTQPCIKEDSPRLLDACDDTAYLATDEYALSKAREENILFESEFRNWTIIRPYITYSEQRLQLGVLEKEGWLYRAVKGRTIVFSNDIVDKYTTLTYGYDVAKGIVSIIGKQETCSKIFHITGEFAIKWKDVLDVYQEELSKWKGSEQKVLMIPLNNRVTFKETQSVYQVKYDRYYDRKFDNDAINRYIDISKFATPREGLSQCIKAFLNDPQFNKSLLNWKMEAYHDRLSGHVASLSEMDTIKDKIKYIIYRYILPISKF